MSKKLSPHREEPTVQCGCGERVVSHHRSDTGAGVGGSDKGKVGHERS